MTMTQDAPMPWRGHIRASVMLGIPLIGSHIAQMLTHTTDVVMLGWYSIEALAAVVLAAQVFFVTFIVGSGFAFAVMPLAASALGADDPKQARRAVRMGLWLVTIYGAVMAVPLWFTETLLLAIGQSEELSAIAGDYMRIAVWGMFPGLWIMVLKSWFGALEKAQIVLWATLIAALANIGFNYALIFGNWGFPEMGARGAAIASVLTTAVDFVFLMAWAALRKPYAQYRLFENPFRADPEALRDVFRLGWPISLTLLAETGLFSAATFLIGWLGTVPLAAHGIVLQISAISFMVPLGMSNVATIRAGRALGRSDTVALYRSSVVVIVAALIAAGIAISLFVTIPEHLIRLFLDPQEPAREQIVQIGRTLLFIAALFQVADGMQVVGLGLLRGIKDTAVPMVFALIGYWGLALPMAWALAFPLGLGVNGVWLGLVIGLTFAAVAMLWRYGVMWRRAV